MKKQLSHALGFTIVELLVSMSLMAAFLLVLTNVFTSVLEVKLESESVSPVTQDGRYIIARLIHDIMRASSISTPSAIGVNGTSLSLIIGGATTTYSQSNGDLILTTGTGSSRLNSSETSVQTIDFSRIGNTNRSSPQDAIHVSLLLQSVAKKNAGVVSKTFSTTVGRRI